MENAETKEKQLSKKSNNSLNRVTKLSHWRDTEDSLTCIFELFYRNEDAYPVEGGIYKLTTTMTTSTKTPN